MKTGKQYLCNSNNWTEYVEDNAPVGTYAV